MSLFKEHNDLKVRIDKINRNIGRDFIAANMSDALFNSICLALSDSYYADYYKRKYKNGKIELFTIKGCKLDVSIESEFILEVFGIMFSKNDRDPTFNEFDYLRLSQFMDVDLYDTRATYGVTGSIFDHWELNMKEHKGALTVWMYINQDAIESEIEDIRPEDVNVLVDTIYDIRHLDCCPELKAIIELVLGALDKQRLLTESIKKYEELCLIFQI